MYLQYGTTALQVIDLNRYERTNVYDSSGTDLLYVRHVIGVSAVYSPGGIPQQPSAFLLSDATKETLDGSDNSFSILEENNRGVDPEGINPTPVLEPIGPTATPVDFQHTGAATDAELRYRLLSPRQQLILWAYDRSGQPIQWLCSPRPGFIVDSKNGPRPMSCDIVSADGEMSVGIFYQVETHTQPCPSGSDRLVLSHRWTMRHTHDQDNYLTRVIEGEIVFNNEVVYATGVNPDWVRNQFIHPVPLGYRRHVPVIEAAADGLSIRYIIEDTDPTIVFEPADSGATEIQISENMIYTRPWVGQQLERISGVSAGTSGYAAGAYIRKKIGHIYDAVTGR